MQIKKRMLLLIICINIIIPWSPIAEETTASVELQGPNEIQVGSTFEMSVNVTNLYNFDAANFDIHFNNSLITFENISNGSINDINISVSMWDLIDENTLRIIINIPGTIGVSGNGTLVKISFTTITDGELIINATDAVFASNQPAEIPTTWSIFSTTIKDTSNDDTDTNDQTDNDGNSPPSSDHSTNSNQPPIATFSTNIETNAYINQTILFNGTLSYDNDGFITQWIWDFGDNTTGNSTITNHTYKLPGNYQVSLTVKDNNGRTTEEVKDIIIHHPQAPSIPIITGPFNGTINMNYSFFIYSKDPNNNPIFFKINWDDNTNIEIIKTKKRENISINHTWNHAGIYEITAIASNTISSSYHSNHIIYINTLYLDNIGYLMDNNNDTYFDTFKNRTTSLENDVLLQNEVYSIDTNNDGIWDYTYNTNDGIKIIEEKDNNDENMSPDFSIFLCIGSIILFICFRYYYQKK